MIYVWNSITLLLPLATESWIKRVKKGDDYLSSSLHIIQSFMDKKIKLFHNWNSGYVLKFCESEHIHVHVIIFLSFYSLFWGEVPVNRSIDR